MTTRNTKLFLLEDGTLCRWTLIPGRPPDTPICSVYRYLQVKLAVMVLAPHFYSTFSPRANRLFRPPGGLPDPLLRQTWRVKLTFAKGPPSEGLTWPLRGSRGPSAGLPKAIRRVNFAVQGAFPQDRLHWISAVTNRVSRSTNL